MYGIIGFFVGILVFYLLVKTVQYTWPVLLILAAWAAWDGYHTYYNTDAGAYADVAYYCDVLGEDKTTPQWQEVYEYTLFDERHLDDTGANYYADLRNTSCDYARSQTEVGEYGVIDEKNDKLGYIRRYFYFENGETKSLYRDKDQFLWQRALYLRVEEHCNLNRETGVCVEVPNNECSWYDLKSSYDWKSCQYDKTGRGNYTQVLRKNMIDNFTW